MNCLIYARVSTERQAEKDLSIPAQVQAMREHAQRQGWTVSGEFIEAGASARTAERPVLKRMLNRCREQPKVDVVLVHKIDRLARNVFDHATIKAHLLKCAVRLASVVENVDDSITGQLVEHIMASLAEFYSGNLAAETRKGMKMKVERGGWPHQPPRGYRVSHDEQGRGRVVVNEIDAPLVRKAFERYATGFVSLKKLGAEMSDEGFRSRTGERLAAGYLRGMLENPFYVGRLRWKGQDFKGTHPPIVAESLFLQVQDVLRARHKNAGDKGRHRFMLRGVAFCNECGARLTAERHDRWSYYRCVRHTVSKALCSAPLSNADRTHGELVALYGRLRVSPRLKQLILEETNRYALARVETARQRVNSVRMQLVRSEERELRMGEAYASGDMAAEIYRALAPKIRSEVVALRVTLREAEVEPRVIVTKVNNRIANVESLRAIYERLANDERHQLARVVFRRITISRGRIVNYALHPPFDQLLSEDDDSTPHLDSQKVVPAIKNILEVDMSAFESLLKSNKAT